MMSMRGPSRSPRDGADVEMENGVEDGKSNTKVIVINNLSRNVVESHLQTIFGFYGQISKIDLPLFGKSGQNRGKAALEYINAPAAHTAASHMDGGQIDGAIVKVELSDLPVRSSSRSHSRPRGRNGRDRSHSLSYSRSRSRSQPPRGVGRRGYDPPRGSDFYRGRPFGRRGPPARDSYRPYVRSRSRSPIRRGGPDRFMPRRRSPSYERGGTGYARGRSRSRSYSVRSSRSRTRSLTRSRSRSYSSYSRYSRSRSRSPSRAKRSKSRDDIRDSRSRSPPK